MSEGNSILDRALDEIVADKASSNQRNRRRGGGNRTPRDGVSKQSRPPRDPVRSNWVHDKFDDGNSYRPRDNRDTRDTRDTRDNGPPRDGARSSKVRVENLHYDLSEEDLRGVFSRVGDIRRIDIVYDKAGRSEGIAHVLYSNPEEAVLAVDQFDGANAKGQPIRVKLASQQGGRRGGGAGGGEGRSLFDRVAAGPRDEEDMEMDGRRGDRRPQQQQSRDQRRDVGEMRQNARDLGIDRYIPGDRGGGDRRGPPRRGGMGGERERRRDGNDRRGGRGGRGGGGGRGDRGDRTGGSNRPRKTAEELDAEMNDYWTPGEGGIQSSFAPGAEGAFANQVPAQQQEAFADPNVNRVTAADVADDL